MERLEKEQVQVVAHGRNWTKLGILALAAIPFAVKVAYLLKAWVTSPVDRIHIGLYGSLSLLFVVIAVAAKLYWRFLTVKPMKRSRSLRLALVPLVLYVIGLIWSVNALQLIASVGFLWAVAWGLYGRVSGLMLAPAAVCAVLAVPGSIYWISRASQAFTGETHAAYAPAFSPDSQKGYLGREIKPDAGFTRFFRTSDAHQFAYANASNAVSVLSVRIGSDVHEIHPATHCLRSGGWFVESDDLRKVELPGRDEPLQVTEAVVQKDGTRALVWIWYSTDRQSVGSFLRFRQLYSREGAWNSFQAMTSVGSDGQSLNRARGVLADFLSGGRAKTIVP